MHIQSLAKELRINIDELEELCCDDEKECCDFGQDLKNLLKAVQ